MKPANRKRRRSARKLWTAPEIALLRKRYPTTATKALAKTLGSTEESVTGAATKLGLRKDAEYLRKLNHQLGMNLAEVGAASQFEKGHTPSNKGVKGWDAGGRSRETRFKKSHKPANFAQIGSHRYSKEGYLQRKVKATGYPPHDWQSVHRLLWEEHNGPIPKGHVVIFKDGNKQNITLNNLQLLTLRENMARNTIARYPGELRAAIHINAKLKRKIDEEQDRRSA